MSSSPDSVLRAPRRTRALNRHPPPPSLHVSSVSRGRRQRGRQMVHRPYSTRSASVYTTLILYEHRLIIHTQYEHRLIKHSLRILLYLFISCKLSTSDANNYIRRTIYTLKKFKNLRYLEYHSRKYTVY